MELPSVSPSELCLSSESATGTNERIASTAGSKSSLGDPPIPYQLYKRRFAGCLGIVLLSGVTATSGPWFGPISNNMVRDFGFTLDQVNWLGIVIGCVYLPTALLLPMFCSRFGIRRCCDVGAVALVLSSWIRFAGTSRSLSVSGSYALLLVGQIIVAICHPIFQVLGPKYSERWFGLGGRTTATTIMAISYPVGGAIGQLVSPLAADSRRSILIQGIICTAAFPAVFLIGEAPPTPPTYAGSKKSQSLSSLIRTMLGKETTPDAYMTPRERIDFSIITIIFAVLVAALNTFALLTAQNLTPFGYSPSICGLMGATMLLTGIAAAFITAPLLDRVLTRHLGITLRVLVPVVAGAWLSLIWAVKPHNTAGLFVIMTILGVCSITLLPIGLELACEVTRNADGSAAILWFSGNLLGIIFPVVEGALRAGPQANPPLNMRKALIFNGVVVMFCSSLIFFVQGRQARRELDELKNQTQQGSRLDKFPDSHTELVGRNTVKTHHFPTSTDSLQSSSAFQTRNILGAGGVSV